MVNIVIFGPLNAVDVRRDELMILNGGMHFSKYILGLQYFVKLKN